MGKIIVQTFLTLDGVMQAPGGPEEDTDGGFQHGGWSVGYWGDVMYEVMGRSFESLHALLLGRRTYEIFAGHWPHLGEDHPEAAAGAQLTGIPKYVASRTMKSASWANTTILDGDAAKSVAKLKQDVDTDIQVHGSSNLVQTLLRHDLVDEFGLWIFPVVLGSGKRLFGDGAIPAGLRLAEAQTSSTGVVIHRYVREGDIKYGSFELPE
jgi:dihydrofolate reductase